MNFQKLLIVCAVLALVLSCEKNPATAADRADRKVSVGAATELTNEEASAWKDRNMNKDETYRLLAEKKLVEKLGGYSEEDREIHTVLRREWDSFVTAHADYDPQIHDNAIIGGVAAKYCRKPDDVKALFSKMESSQILTSEEVEKLRAQAGF